MVDAIAAGTLKMIDITAFKFSNMNTVARRFAKNLIKQRSLEVKPKCYRLDTNATMKKMRPSPKINLTRRERPFLGYSNLYAVKHRTKKSKHIE